jgi:hypothetical protein
MEKLMTFEMWQFAVLVWLICAWPAYGVAGMLDATFSHNARQNRRVNLVLAIFGGPVFLAGVVLVAVSIIPSMIVEFGIGLTKKLVK